MENFMKRINLMIKLSAVLIFFFILACSTASADSVSITSPSPDANFQLDSNQNPPTVIFYASLYTSCGYGTDVFHWKGVLNYNYLAENGTIQTKQVIFSENTNPDNSGWDTNTTWTPNLQGIKMIGGSMDVEVSTTYDTVLSDTRHITFGPNNYKLDVTPNPPNIVLHDLPYPDNVQDGGPDQLNPTSPTIDIKVTKNGQPLSEPKKVHITAITVPASGDHTHDSLRDPNSQGNRPSAKLNGESNDIIATTNSLGIAHIKYTPPSVGPRIVAGTDKITVSLVDQPEIKSETHISVGYSDSSGNTEFIHFVGDQNVVIDSAARNIHDDFYCTAATSASIHEIAKNYRTWFDKTYSKPGDPTFSPLNVTAISLMYGGLSDIRGDWKLYHETHSNGKCVDIRSSNLPHVIDKKTGQLVLDDKVLKKLNKLYTDTGNARRTEILKEGNGCLHFSFRN